MSVTFNPNDVVLENNKAIYEIDQVGEIGGSYKGIFEFRCFLNPVQYISADRDYRDLIGKNPALADPHADNLAYALIQLKYRVIKAPPFWYSDESPIAGGNVADSDIILNVLSAATEAEVKFRKHVLEKQEESVNKLKAIIDKRKANAEADAELAEMDKEQEEEEEESAEQEPVSANGATPDTKKKLKRK
jgi:hypothetical protein